MDYKTFRATALKYNLLGEAEYLVSRYGMSYEEALSELDILQLFVYLVGSPSVKYLREILFKQTVYNIRKGEA